MNKNQLEVLRQLMDERQECTDLPEGMVIARDVFEGWRPKMSGSQIHNRIARRNSKAWGKKAERMTINGSNVIVAPFDLVIDDLRRNPPRVN